MVDDLLEDFENATRILVGHHRDDPDQRREGKGFGDRGRGRPSAVRVVGDIEDDGWRAAYDLQPAWKMHLSEPLPNYVRMECLQTEECLGCGKCLRSVG